MIFSVVIPCYDCVKTLEATVNSVRACGLTDYEILLIDDGSADGTTKLCDTLCVRHPELRCIKPNPSILLQQAYPQIICKMRRSHTAILKLLKNKRRDRQKFIVIFLRN